MKRLYEIARELTDLYTKSSRLSWAHYTTGYDFGVMEVQREVQDKLTDAESWDVIQELKNRELSEEDRRRVVIMENLFRPYHLSPDLNRLSLEIHELTNDLASVLNNHRSTFEGRETASTELARILQSDPDRERRKMAFLAQTQVNEPLVEAGFIRLLDLRREFAREYGAVDFVEYELEMQELEPGMFHSWRDQIGQVLKQLKEVRGFFGEKYLKDPQVMPWDEGFIAGSIAPELNSRVNMTGYHGPISNLFQRFGIDITGMNITYDIFPRRNKSEWGYNFPVEAGIDSRILANVRDRYSQYGVLLHETGHAVHSFMLDPGETIMNMGISGIVSEGIANLFGSYRGRSIFYREFFSDGMETAGRNFKLLKLWNRAAGLRSTVRILFDQALYRTSIQSMDDIHKLMWKTRSDLLNEKPYWDQPLWGRTIHYTTHPIYLHNYLMGDLFCDAVEDAFIERENVSGPEEAPQAFGRFLTDEVIAVSGRYPFPELFRRICGQDISLEILCRKFRSSMDALM